MVRRPLVRVFLVAAALGVSGALGMGAPSALAGLDGYSQWIDTDRSVSSAQPAAVDSVPASDDGAAQSGGALHGNAAPHGDGAGRGNGAAQSGGASHGDGAPQDGKEMSEKELKAEITKLWGENAGKKMRKAEPMMVPYKEKTWATMVTEPSPNWAGYKSKVSGIYGAIGYMTAKRCYNGDSGVFVGITDDQNELIQAGVDMQNMTAFVECIPNTAKTVFSVAQNDRILVSVRQQAGSTWNVVIYNTTSGRAYGKYYTYYGPNKYACWILETQYRQHAGSWGTVNFSQCNWVNSAGTRYGITSGSGYYYKKVMTTYFGERVTPSAVSGGAAFSVTRY